MSVSVTVVEAGEEGAAGSVEERGSVLSTTIVGEAGLGATAGGVWTAAGADVKIVAC